MAKLQSIRIDMNDVLKPARVDVYVTFNDGAWRAQRFTCEDSANTVAMQLRFLADDVQRLTTEVKTTEVKISE